VAVSLVGAAAVWSLPVRGADPAPSGATADFNKGFDDWKALLSRLREMQIRHQTAKADERLQLEKDFAQQVVIGRKMEVELTGRAEKAYAENPDSASPAAEFLFRVAVDNASNRDNFELAERISKLLIAHNFKNSNIYDLAGVAAFCTNDYDAAEKYWNKAAELKVQPSALTAKLQPSLKDYKQMWTKEEALREAEAKADDLPRVKLETTSGTIVVELFENEAPNTVANFISLVEKKFYDGVKFHRVLDHFMAQTGDPTGTGSGGPGYKIACECVNENHRNHFRGSLSMAHAGRNTGGSQFFLTFLPTPHLNGLHTVFGRVIEGMDVMSNLERVDPNNPIPGVTPDKIISATVIRKRNHPYEPKKLAS
jgi:cyclophilin family peptidyl-prolyl cis-trans isomerase